MSVSREKLYEEVWAEPMTTVALRYDVSSSFLARVCERLSVPRPPRGYWPQVKVGKKNPRPPLPPAEPGDDLEWARDGAEPARQPVVAGPRGRRSKRGAADRPAQHPLLVGVRDSFDVARVSKSDSEKYARPYKRNIVDVFVSKDLVKRALDAASDLFLSLQDRGHRVILGDARYRRVTLHHREGEKPKRDVYYDGGRWRGPARPTLLFINAVPFGLTVFEISEEIEVRYDSNSHGYVRIPKSARQPVRLGPGDWTTRKWMCSGRLGVHAYSPEPAVRWDKYWHEQVPGDLAKSFGAMAKELEGAAPLMLELKAEAERDAEEERKKGEAELLERQQKEAERQKVEDEKQRLEDLKRELDSWRFARDARALVAELKDMVASRGLHITVGGELEEWVTWVLQQADEADPIADLRHDADAMAKKFRTLGRRPSPVGATLRRHRARQGR